MNIVREWRLWTSSFLASAGFQEPADMNARLSDVAGVRAVELELGFNRVEEYADASSASIS